LTGKGYRGEPLTTRRYSDHCRAVRRNLARPDPDGARAIWPA
jgi:hypothetical protein